MGKAKERMFYIMCYACGITEKDQIKFFGLPSSIKSDMSDLQRTIFRVPNSQGSSDLTEQRSPSPSDRKLERQPISEMFFEFLNNEII